MGVYLVTGRGGTGKSAICAELQKRGYPAYDADMVPGLCRWEDRKTGELTAVDPKKYIDFKKVAWVWQHDVFHMLLESRKDIILCGSSSNQEKYYQLFDKIFVLVLDPDTHLHRLKTRDFDYGKDPKLQQELTENHQIFASKLIKQGAFPIDVTGSLESEVDEIVSNCKLPVNEKQRLKR